jgi:predicted membrane protein
VQTKSLILARSEMCNVLLVNFIFVFALCVYYVLYTGIGNEQQTHIRDIFFPLVGFDVFLIEVIKMSS